MSHMFVKPLSSGEFFAIREPAESLNVGENRLGCRQTVLNLSSSLCGNCFERH